MDHPTNADADWWFKRGYEVDGVWLPFLARVKGKRREWIDRSARYASTLARRRC